MKMVFGVAVAAAALMATPAAAANGAGPRVEARLGFDRTTLKLGYDDGVDSFSDSGHDSGLGIGAEVGYDMPVGTAGLIGAYAGIEGSTTKECSEVYGDDKACLRIGRNLTLGARAGVRMSPTMLVYGKAGYSNGQLRVSYVDHADSSNDFKAHSNRGGVHFGAGVEAALSATTYVRGEYVRTEYKGYKDSSYDIGLDGHRDQVVMGFGLRF